jgi:hypothetical protein
MSFFGDLHPSYRRQRSEGHGFSAKRGYPVISRTLASLAGLSSRVERLSELLRIAESTNLRAVVHERDPASRRPSWK